MHASRFIRSAVSAAALALSLAPAANAHTVRPASHDDSVATCAPIARTGTYRMTIARDGELPKLALLVLERAGGCQSATIVTETGSAVLYIHAMDDSSLSAGMRTEQGIAEVSLKFADDGVTGTVTRGKKSWDVSGERTS